MRNSIRFGSLMLLCGTLSVGVGRAAIVANFADGFGTASADQYVGIAGNGWATPWTVGTTSAGASAPAVLDTSPLNGGGNYLSVPYTLSTGTGTSRTAVRRQFGTFDSVDPTLPYTVSFDFRPEAINTTSTSFADRYQLFGNTVAANDSGNLTWSAIAAAGPDTGPSNIVGQHWGFQTNLLEPKVTAAVTEMTFVDSGITMVPNTVYHFEISVNPAAKTYVGKISDGVTTFESGTLYFRNQGASATTASFLIFGGSQRNSGTAGATPYPFSVDSISVAAETAGDFDGDGDVDGADFIVWQTNFPTASGATPAQGDADGDNDVDGADFAAWQNSFPSPSSGVAPVPEPNAALLAALGAIAALAYRRRNSSVN